MTTLRFVPFLEFKLLQGEAELYEQREYPFYQEPVRAFAVPVIGTPADALEWRVYDRTRFLELLRRLRRGAAIDEESVVRLFGLDQAPAEIVDPGQGEPDDPAVVVDRNRIIGVWVEPSRPSQTGIAGVGLSAAALGITVAIARQTPRIARTPRLNYYVGREARDVEPPVETLVEAEELGSRIEGAPRRLGRTPRVADETIRRTPHLEVDDDPPLRPGTAFDAYVFTDKAPPPV